MNIKFADADIGHRVIKMQCTVSCQKYSRKMADVKIELHLSRFGYFELRKK